MRTIEIKYKRIGIGRTLRATIPESYGEMSEAQYLSIFQLSTGDIGERKFMSRFFGIRLGLLDKMDDYAIYELTNLMNFLEESENAACNAFLLKRLGRYVAPLDKLRGMSFQQFMTIDTMSSWYGVTKNADYLNMMLAACYLREGTTYFDDEGKDVLDMTRESEAMMKRSEAEKLAVLTNWAMIKNWLSGAYKYLFPRSDGKKNENEKPRPAQWLKLFDKFVGDNIADIDAYKRLPCMDAFRILNERIKEAEK